MEVWNIEGSSMEGSICTKYRESWGGWTMKEVRGSYGVLEMH